MATEASLGKNKCDFWLLITAKAFFTCREACLDVLLKARSFFIRGLVKRWGWTGSPWSGVNEWLHSSCSRIGAFMEAFVRRLSSGIWQEFKEAFCHSRVIIYPAASWSDSVGSSQCNITIMAHLCIVELLLKDLNIEAVLPPGVQHKRLSHLSCGPIDLKSNKHIWNQDLPMKCWIRACKSVVTAPTFCFHSLWSGWSALLKMSAPVSRFRTSRMSSSRKASGCGWNRTSHDIVCCHEPGTIQRDINTEVKLSSYLHLQWPVHFFLRSQSVFEGCRCPRGWNRDSFTERRSPRSNKWTEKKIGCAQALLITLHWDSVGTQGAMWHFFKICTHHSLSGAWVWSLCGVVCWWDTSGHRQG